MRKTGKTKTRSNLKQGMSCITSHTTKSPPRWRQYSNKHTILLMKMGNLFWRGKKENAKLLLHKKIESKFPLIAKLSMLGGKERQQFINKYHKKLQLEIEAWKPWYHELSVAFEELRKIKPDWQRTIDKMRFIRPLHEISNLLLWYGSIVEFARITMKEKYGD